MEKEIRMDLKVVCNRELYLPEYGNPTDACMDLRVKLTGEEAFIMPGCTETFSTGLQVAVPEGFVMLVYPRSSTGFKLRCALANGTGVIDAGYRDEIKLALYNFGTETVKLVNGQRVAQFLLLPFPKLNLIQVEDDDNFRNGDRGGGLGSTGEV
jgi:dUTP pyrophosphatase